MNDTREWSEKGMPVIVRSCTFKDVHASVMTRSSKFEQFLSTRVGCWTCCLRSTSCRMSESLSSIRLDAVPGALKSSHMMKSPGRFDKLSINSLHTAYKMI